MPVFQYKAIQSDGSIAQGEIEANGRSDAFKTMEARGLRPVKLAEATNGRHVAKLAESRKRRAEPSEKPKETTPALQEETARTKFSFGGKKITARMLENFTRLLSSLLAAGVPLS